MDNIIQKLASIKASLIEDKDEFLAFKKRCEGDLASLKNLTLNVLQSFKGGKYILQIAFFQQSF